MFQNVMRWQCAVRGGYSIVHYLRGVVRDRDSYALA